MIPSFSLIIKGTIPECLCEFPEVQYIAAAIPEHHRIPTALGATLTKLLALSRCAPEPVSEEAVYVV